MEWERTDRDITRWKLNNKERKETNMGIKIKDFLKLSGDKGESVMLYECDTEKAITVAVKDLFDIFKLSRTDIYNVKAEYVDIMEAEIASWEYDDGIICIYYFL